jgi:amino acid transporter
MARTPTTDPDRAPRKLSTLDSFAIGISNVGPTLSVGVGLGVLVAVVGAQMPATFVLAALPMLGIAVAYAYLNREEPNCGTSYVWLRKAFNPWIGFLTGFIGVAASVVFLAYGAPLAGQITVSLIRAVGVHTIAGIQVDPSNNFQNTIVGLLWLALVTSLAVRGTQVAARVQVALVGIEIAIVGVIGVVAITVGKASPVRLEWFNPLQVPSPALLISGLVLTVYVFWGWDSAFNVNEETANPRQAARAGFATIIVVLAMFVFAAIMFLRALTSKELLHSGFLALPYLGGKLFGPAGEALAAVALLFSAVALLQAVVIAIARVTLSMGRDRTLGPVWAQLHPKHGTPARGTLLLAGIAAAISIAAATIGPLQTVITGLVSGIGILVSLIYGLGGLAAAWRFRRMLATSPGRAILTVILPFLSALTLFSLGGVFTWQEVASTNHWTFSATNGWFIVSVPLIIILLGVIAAAGARFWRRSPYFTDPNFVEFTVREPMPSPITNTRRG